MYVPDIHTILGAYNPISLEEMDNIRLMNRVDTKYVFSVCKLPALLNHLAASYKILEIGEEREFLYDTRYLDTPEDLFFTQHVTGKLARHKVRYRKYESTGKTFLEIKRKTNTNRTVKWRIENNLSSGILNEEASAFIQKHAKVNSTELHPVLLNTFARATLAGIDTVERITIDYNLCFSTLNGGERKLPFLAIAELKSEGYPKHTPFESATRQLHIQPTEFSKYCIGTALLRDVPRKNILKSKMLLLNKIEYEYSKSNGSR